LIIPLLPSPWPKSGPMSLGARIACGCCLRQASYEFGKERFDLIVFSWAMPLIDVKKVVDSLKPGGARVNGVCSRLRRSQWNAEEVRRPAHRSAMRSPGLSRIGTGRREIEILRMVATKAITVEALMAGSRANPEVGGHRPATTSILRLIGRDPSWLAPRCSGIPVGLLVSARLELRAAGKTRADSGKRRT